MEVLHFQEITLNAAAVIYFAYPSDVRQNTVTEFLVMTDFIH